MRISDWSSDVCSSDLSPQHSSAQSGRSRISVGPEPSGLNPSGGIICGADTTGAGNASARPNGMRRIDSRPTMGADRKSVVEGKMVSVRLDLGGRRILNTKNLRPSIVNHLEFHQQHQNT